MTPDQPWMWHWGGMWIFPLIMFAVMIICFFLFFSRGGRRPPWCGPWGHQGKGGETDSALEILKKRYAKGDITKEEYEQMKKEIVS